jgi:hypothetical protein
MRVPFAAGRDQQTPAQAASIGETRSVPLGTKTIEGFTVVGTRTVTTIPTGRVGNDRPIEIIDERWESAELKILVRSLHHDPRTGDVEYTLSKISRAEPAASLFVVPPGYVIQRVPVR